MHSYRYQKAPVIEPVSPEGRRIARSLRDMEKRFYKSVVINASKSERKQRRHFINEKGAQR